MARKLHAILYTMTDCPFCARAREILKEMKIPFEERNVTENVRWHKELIERTSDDKLPTVLLNGEILVKPGEDKLRATINYEMYRP